MKRKIMAMVLGFILPGITFANGMMVFDIENWLQAIDNVYATYDMVNNSITQIENQYKQIQRAIDNAKNIDWDNISFDGDIDIRNDIRNATKKINRLLNDAREISETLETPFMNLGEKSYSIADLCGKKGNQMGIAAAMLDVKNYMAKNMESVLNSLEKEMTPEEKEAVWNMYGISPKNYLYVQQSATLVKDKAAAALAKVQDKAKEMEVEYVRESNSIIEAALASKDAEGNMTQGAANEGIMRMLHELNQWLYRLGTDINDATALSATKMINDQAEKEAEADTRRQLKENEQKYQREENIYWKSYEN